MAVCEAPEAEVGAVLEYQIKDRLTKPLIPGQFWLDYDFFNQNIVLDQELEVHVPVDRALTIESPELKPTIRDEGKERIYTWKSSHLKSASPKSQPLLGKLPPPDVEISTFHSWEEVGRWWEALEKPQAAPTPEIQAKAAELIKDAKTDDEKIQAIYHYVATKFHYVSLSFGIGAYQPHPADDVLSNEYGDCKDKHTLLESLLRAAGLDAYPALINSLRELDPKVPTPSQFDHVISVVPEGQHWLWLDTTSEVAPEGLLTANLRDKMALVIPDDKPASLVKTPALPPFKMVTTFEANGALDDSGTFQGKMKETARGDLGLILRYVFRRMPEAQWKDLVQSVSYASGFGGTVSNVAASSPEDTEHPFHYSYDYKRKNYSDWSEKKISAPFPPLNLPAVSDDADKSKEPIRLGPPNEVIYTCTMKLPSNYTLELPAAVNWSRDYADYQSKYSFENGTLQVERRLTIKMDEVPQSERDDYKKFQKAVSDDTQFITLTSGSKTDDTEEMTLDQRMSPEVGMLLQQAAMSASQGDLSGALEEVKKAHSMDPNNLRSMTLIGILNIELGHSAEGLSQIRQVMAADPANFDLYLYTTQALEHYHKLDEAADVWREFIKRNPTSSKAHENLAHLLTWEKKPNEALVEYQAAAKLDPSNTGYGVEIGSAYLGLGQTDQAAAAFDKALAEKPDPDSLNDAAYELADHNVKLDDAERYSLEAVKEQEAVDAKIDLSSLTTPELRSMSSLAAYWDTLGWVYFREGKLEAAEKYLKAAWKLDQRSAVADHLGQLYEKLGRKREAIHLYTLSLGLNSHVTETRARLERLVKSPSRIDAGVSNAGAELSEMRTIVVSRQGLKPGEAEFFVLLGPGGKVEGEKFIHGDDKLKAAAKAIETAKYDEPFPDDAPTKIVRRGILSCSSVSPRCVFVLMPVESVFSVE